MTCEYFEDPPRGQVGLRSPPKLRSCGLQLGGELQSDSDVGSIWFGKGGKCESSKNLHSIVRPAGATKIG